MVLTKNLKIFQKNLDFLLSSDPVTFTDLLSKTKHWFSPTAPYPLCLP